MAIAASAQTVKSYALPDHSDIYYKKIESSGFHFIIPKNTLKNKSFNNQYVLEHPLITYNTNLPYITPWCKKMKVDVNKIKVKAIVDEWASVVEMVEQGLGFTLCPRGVKSKDKNVVSVPIDRKILPEINFYLLYKKETKNLSPIEKIVKL